MKRVAGLSLLIALAVFLSPRAGRGADPQLPHFQTSDRCMACHNSLSTPDGEDISIGLSWRASMMANSARDPYWQAGVRRETLDHPESKALIEDECAICHMPMARYEAKLQGKEAEIFSHLPFDSEDAYGRLAIEGVSCSLCHQITPDKLGTRESYVGGFVIDVTHTKGEKPMYGPFKIDDGHTQIMRSSSGGFKPTESEHIRKSELCATCHTLITKALDASGKVIGSLPEQMPYEEWLHSDFRNTKSCQSCHMPVVKEKVPVTRVLGEPREGFSRHVFVGGNFFIQRMLNKYRGDLSVAALPQELEAAANRTVSHLQSESARVSIVSTNVLDGRLSAEIAVENLGGHKLPTAYPSRRVWLHVTVRNQGGEVVFESGSLQPNGLIRGNDNDADAARFEPHYQEISSADQVQIYEGIMVGASGSPTTGLLQAVRYEKDNRLLPRGFDKATASEEIAVRGPAAQDTDFIAGGDRVRYSIPLAGAQGRLQIEAELWYQPISYRWAENLRSYDSFETKRFNGYYDAMASGSAVMLAHASAAR
jgi:hypothetical protein